METINGVLLAFGAFGWHTAFLIVLGIVVGLIIGVLPGLNYLMGVLLVLPFTYAMEPLDALILLLAMYVSGTYGGAIIAILVNIPGEPGDAALLPDGHGMCRQGRAAEALGWAAFAALVGGMLSWLVLVLVAQPFGSIVLGFGSAEYFAIVLFGLVTVFLLAETSLTSALISAFAGMLISTVGVSAVHGTVRYDFGTSILRDGIDWIPILIGVYAVAETIERFSQRFAGKTEQAKATAGTTLPRLPAIWERRGSLARGTMTGVFLGAVPGAGATVSSFIAYGFEKQFGKFRKDLGTGSPSGVVVCQSAMTASVGTALIPLLTIGIPGSAVTAVMLGVLLFHDVQVGPLLFASSPDIVYGMIAILPIGLLLMFVLGIVGAKAFIRVLSVPETYIAATVILFSYIGAFSLRQSMTDVWVMTAFGVIGLYMRRAAYPIVPLILGAILGPLAERHFLTAMIASGNDWSTFFTRPVSGILIGILFIVVALTIVKSLRRRRRKSEPGVRSKSR